MLTDELPHTCVPNESITRVERTQRSGAVAAGWRAGIQDQPGCSWRFAAGCVGALKRTPYRQGVPKRKKDPAEHPAVVRLLERARRLAESGSAPRKHHLVPRSYLKRWAEDGLIRVTDVRQCFDYTTSPANAARETDFYSLASDDLDPERTPPLLFEVLLSEIEGWGVEGIDHLLRMPQQPDPHLLAKFTWFLGMTMTRGNSTRRRLRKMSEEVMRLEYGSITRSGVTSMMRGAGLDTTEAAVEDACALVDEIREGTVVLSPQDAALIGLAAEVSYRMGEELLRRKWMLFKTPQVLVTCDEPVVVVGGPGHRRSERAGLDSAGAVVFPLTPGMGLVMFHPERAARLGLPDAQLPVAQLDHAEVFELNREIAMSCHRWVFERPGKRVGARLQIPADPGTAVLEERPDLQAIDQPDGEVIRVYDQTRWRSAAPWPVASWWI